MLFLFLNSRPILARASNSTGRSISKLCPFFEFRKCCSASRTLARLTQEMSKYVPVCFHSQMFSCCNGIVSIVIFSIAANPQPNSSIKNLRYDRFGWEKIGQICSIISNENQWGIISNINSRIIFNRFVSSVIDRNECERKEKAHQCAMFTMW